MKRRDFVKAAGLGVAGIGAGTIAKPAIAQSQPAVTWRLQSSYPKSLDTIYGASAMLSKMVAEATDNQFKIQVFAAGEIVPALGVLDAVQNGTVEAGQSGAYFYIGKDMAFAFGTAIPWGPNSRIHNGWFYHGGGNELLNEVYAKFNVYGLPAGNTGTQAAGFFRKELKSKADLSGLKMRIGGLGGNLLQRLGVVPQQLGAGDIYPALERGVIDAAEFVGPYDDEKLGLARIAPNYYFPGFWEGNAALTFFFNLDKWNALPKPYQSLVQTAAMAAGLDMQAKYDAQNPPALKRLVAAGAQLRLLPMDIMEATYSEAAAMFAEIGAKNPLFKKLYDSQTAFNEAGTSWWQIAEANYDALSIQLGRKFRK